MCVCQSTDSSMVRHFSRHKSNQEFPVVLARDLNIVRVFTRNDDDDDSELLNGGY